jgi:mRNA-degrading endonuclease RelE of RelBE toxin-antitoxin system
MPDKEYRIEISPAANDKMYDHFKFLARVSPSAAYRLRDTIIGEIQSLDYMPYRYPEFNRAGLPTGKYRYRVIEKRYRIVYQVVDNVVYVDDIQDCRQDDDTHVVK